jgi:hypothetical protein
MMKMIVERIVEGDQSGGINWERIDVSCLLEGERKREGIGS